MTYHTKDAQALILGRRIAADTIYELLKDTGSIDLLPKVLIPGAYTQPDEERTVYRMVELGNMGLGRLVSLSLDVGGPTPISLLQVLQDAEKSFSLQIGVKPTN